MIRFPGLIALELLCALSMALVARAGLRARHDPRPLEVALSVLGEREQRDGSWSGVDLLERADLPTDRFQLTLTPDRDAQVELDSVGPNGVERIFPTQGHDGTLRAHTTYALPGPHGFYEIEGRVRLRLVVRSTGIEGAQGTPLAVSRRTIHLPLSDGSRFQATERSYRIRGEDILEWDLHR